MSGEYLIECMELDCSWSSWFKEPELDRFITFEEVAQGFVERGHIMKIHRHETGHVWFRETNSRYVMLPTCAR